MKHLKGAVVMLLAVALFVLTRNGEAVTYEWTDDGGVVHFTDDQGRIPQKYLKRVRELNTGSDAEVKTPSAPAPAMKSTPPEASSPARKDRLYGGYGEGYWRSKFAAVRGEIKNLEESLPAMKEELNKLSRKRVVYGRTSDRVGRDKAAQEIVKIESRIKALQEELKTLDNEASQAEVPLEWRQPMVTR